MNVDPSDRLSHISNTGSELSALQGELGLQIETEKPSKRLRRGRSASTKRLPTSQSLFADGETDRIASTRLVWEGASVLSQARDLPWTMDGDESPYYESSVGKGKGAISFWVTDNLYSAQPGVLEGEVALALIDQFDVRAACLHLIYAAHATQSKRPWEEQFVLSDTQLEHYLGLDGNRNFKNRQEKLLVMLELAKQPCRLLVYVSWPSHGKVKSLAVSRTWLWEIAEPILYFQERLHEDGLSAEQNLIGFDLKIRCGNWAQYFLNEEGRLSNSSYYEYGVISKNLLRDVMGTWYHCEGAARLMTWLLFKTRVNRHSPITVTTLLKVAFGDKKLEEAKINSDSRRGLVTCWLVVIRVLIRKGWLLSPDPNTYPMEYWEPVEPDLEIIPDDPEAAALFWAEDANKAVGERLTDVKPRRRNRNQFLKLLTGRLWISPPTEIAEKLDEINQRRQISEKSSTKPSSRKTTQPKKHQLEGKSNPLDQQAAPLPKSSPQKSLALKVEKGEDLKSLRLEQGWTQFHLAGMLHRSVSWVKMVEAGRRNLQDQDKEALTAWFKNQELAKAE